MSEPTIEEGTDEPDESEEGTEEYPEPPGGKQDDGEDNISPDLEENPEA